MENEQEWNIEQLLSTSSAFWRSSTIHAAVKLEIFFCDWWRAADS